MKRALVVYFSATGVTKRIANMLATSLGVKSFEIVPHAIYTKSDLDWTNDNSRSTVEMKDRTCRPKIESRVEDIKKYDVIFLGFPIWWYREPSIIDTFIESHNLDDKLIVPFATSGGSGMGEAPKNIQALAPKSKVERGKVFESGVTAEELRKWAEKYLKKGMKICVSGRIQTGSYTNEAGQTVYTTDIICDDQEFAEGKRTDEARNAYDDQIAQAVQGSAARQQVTPRPISPPEAKRPSRSG